MVTTDGLNLEKGDRIHVFFVPVKYVKSGINVLSAKNVGGCLC